MEYVSISEAARRLGVSRKTVYRRMESGQLHAIDTPEGKQVLMEGHTPHTVPPHTSAHVPHTGEHTQAHTPDAHPPRDEHAEMRARLDKAEARVDELLRIVRDQTATITSLNQTVQGQAMILARIEGRMIEPETSTAPTQTLEPPAAQPAPPRTGWSLRALYRAWRGR